MTRIDRGITPLKSSLISSLIFGCLSLWLYLSRCGCLSLSLVVSLSLSWWSLFRLISDTKARVGLDDLSKFDWERTDRDQGNFDTKMMTFLWFDERVASKGVWCCEWLDGLRQKHILHEYPCFYALQETAQRTFLVTLCMVMTTGKQPFCAFVRLIISVVHGLTMRDALRFWWDQRSCFQYICRTAVMMRRTTSRRWKR